MSESASDAAGRTSPLATARWLYEGDGEVPQRFRYALLAFDAVTILYVVISSFVARGPIIQGLDVVLGVLILIDLAIRLAVARRRLRLLVNPVTIADILATASFLVPVLGDEYAFLRVLRTLRFLHTYQLARRMKADFPFFRRHRQVITATVNLAVFIFVMTGIVYATQHDDNVDIANYADSLYFTVTALTTTGFGDITLPGTAGRMISVIIMLFGVTLFLRLAQVLFRPEKVEKACTECGLNRHDPDATHCKHCGNTMRIETEGAA